MSRLQNIKRVQQETPGGCVIASLAMIGGMTFREVLAEYPWSETGCDMETVSEDFCQRHGFARARIYRWHPGPSIKEDQDWKVEQDKRRRDPWPPLPFAPAHLCMVRTSQYHCVVMLADGTVLDPLTPEPKRLSDYSETTQVHGIWDIR